MHLVHSYKGNLGCSGFVEYVRDVTLLTGGTRTENRGSSTLLGHTAMMIVLVPVSL